MMKFIKNLTSFLRKQHKMENYRLENFEISLHHNKTRVFLMIPRDRQIFQAWSCSFIHQEFEFSRYLDVWGDCKSRDILLRRSKIFFKLGWGDGLIGILKNWEVKGGEGRGLNFSTNEVNVYWNEYNPDFQYLRPNLEFPWKISSYQTKPKDGADEEAMSLLFTTTKQKC